MPKIPALPAIASPAALDELPIEDVSASTTKKITLSQMRDFLGIGTGWNEVTDTWTYASADAPSYVVTVPSGAASLYALGMRVRLTHGAAVKYFFITKISDTTLTLYGGTDYTLSGTTISNISVSFVNAFGFPTDPAKWTQSVTDSTERSQSTPSSGQWYNVGSFSLAIPIGLWHVSYNINVYGSNSTAASVVLRSTLSTANNSETDIDMSAKFNGYSNNTATSVTNNPRKYLALTTKTTYYLNTSTSGNGTLFNENSDSRLYIKAVCAYLFT